MLDESVLGPLVTYLGLFIIALIVLYHWLVADPPLGPKKQA